LAVETGTSKRSEAVSSPAARASAAVRTTALAPVSKMLRMSAPLTLAFTTK